MAFPRVRNNPKLRVAACNVRGTVRGDWLVGTGRVIEDDAHIDRIEAALEPKYGFLMKLTSFFKRAFGAGRKGRSYLELTIGPWIAASTETQAS
jgi:hypothetical protein